jgi:hypothetical protein
MQSKKFIKNLSVFLGREYVRKDLTGYISFFGLVDPQLSAAEWLESLGDLSELEFQCRKTVEDFRSRSEKRFGRGHVRNRPGL